MNILLTAFKTSFSLLLLLATIPGYSQIFEWCKDGYKFNDRNPYNIDNSGIYIKISGLYPSILHPANCNNNEPFIITGVNNGGTHGAVHNYRFDFSENVDVEFTVSGIDADTTGNFRYFDRLQFSPTPTFSYYSPSLAIKDDTILPNPENPLPLEVRVNNKNINSFSIQHGLGKRYNPGYIIISSLIINNDKLGEAKIINKIANEELAVFKENAAISNAHFISSTGQLVNAKYTTESYGYTRIDTKFLAAGIYFIFVEFSTGHFLKEKVLIQH